MNPSSHYESPLATRYASSEMSYLFSPRFKYLTWRELWIALAKGEKALGLPITDHQINELESRKEHIDMQRVHEYEK